MEPSDDREPSGDALGNATLSDPTVADPALVDRSSPAPTPASASRFLVVEDDHAVAKVIARHLARYRLTQIASSIHEARAALADTTTWCGMVLDITLPDGSGLDLLEGLRAEGHELPVIVLTGHHDPALINRAQRSMAQFACKPWPTEGLRSFAEWAIDVERAPSERLSFLMDELVARYPELEQTTDVAQLVIQLRQAQRGVARSEERYRRVFEAVSDAILTVDARTLRIVDANRAACASLGYRRQELAEVRVSSLVEGLEEEALPRLRLGEDLSIERTLIHKKDGSAFPAHLRGAAFTVGGRFLFVLVISDLTDREHREHARQRFLRGVLTAQEDERRRIARDLHDDAGQRLTSLLLGLRALENITEEEPLRERVAALREHTRNILEDLGRMARGMHPSALEDVGLVAVMERDFRQFENLTGVQVSTSVEGMSADERLSRAMEITLYRILQEALTNARKHANAKRVDVRLNVKPDKVLLDITDDGCGFDLDSALGSGLGLQSMRERASLLDGTLEIESSDGGSSLHFELPRDPLHERGFYDDEDLEEGEPPAGLERDGHPSEEEEEWKRRSKIARESPQGPSGGAPPRTQSSTRGGPKTPQEGATR